MAKRVANLIEATLPPPPSVDAFVTIIQAVNENLSRPAAQDPVFGGMFQSRKPRGSEGTPPTDPLLNARRFYLPLLNCCYTPLSPQIV